MAVWKPKPQADWAARDKQRLAQMRAGGKRKGSRASYALAQLRPRPITGVEGKGHTARSH